MNRHLALPVLTAWLAAVGVLLLIALLVVVLHLAGLSGSQIIGAGLMGFVLTAAGVLVALSDPKGRP